MFQNPGKAGGKFHTPAPAPLPNSQAVAGTPSNSRKHGAGTALFPSEPKGQDLGEQRKTRLKALGRQLKKTKPQTLQRLQSLSWSEERRSRSNPNQGNHTPQEGEVICQHQGLPGRVQRGAELLPPPPHTLTLTLQRSGRC